MEGEAISLFFFFPFPLKIKRVGFSLQAACGTFCIYTEALNGLTLALANFFFSSKKISALPQKPHYSWLNLQTPLDQKYQKIACPISCCTFPGSSDTSN